MSESIENIVILGAGHAGASAAFELRRRDFDGRIILVGDEQEPPYERPQLSKEMLRKEPVALRHHQTAQEYEDEAIELFLGDAAVRVDAVTRTVHLASGMQLPYDRLLVATGTRARKLVGIPEDHVAYLRTATDAKVLCAHLDAARRIVIVGGGVIGLEVASAISARGGHPVVLEREPRLMSRSLDELVAGHLEKVHIDRGVRFVYGVTVKSFEAGLLVLSDGTELPADELVVGIGVEPNIEALAGLRITDAHGVQVDALGRTAIPEIYATGDVASQPREGAYGRIETWANAQDHSAHVARNLVGGEEPYTAPPWFWSDQGDVRVQVVGNVTRGSRHLRGTVESGKFSAFYLEPDGTILGCAAVNAPSDMVVARRWMIDEVKVAPDRLGAPDLQAARR
ncbi:MAG: FAD-dependent oxidoreductase [Polyangia bacterium]